MTAGETCPYCNAVLAAAVEFCPVCGERLKTLPSAGTSAPVLNTPRTVVPPPARPSSRTIAGAILSVMAGCALVGLIFALTTRANRRANDHAAEIRPARSPFDRPELPSGPGPVSPVPPRDLQGLRYLPGNLDLLVGLHFASLYEDPSTRRLLDQPLPSGPGRFRLKDLQTWVGVAPEAIDHAVLGVGLPRGGLPQVLLVVRTRHPADVPAIRETLGARRVTDAGPREPRELWNIRLPGVGLAAVLWFADDRTLVLGLNPSDFTDIPSRPHQSLDHLREKTRSLVTSWLDPGTCLWAVADLPGGWPDAANLALSGLLDRWQVTAEQRQALKEVRSVAAGVVLVQSEVSSRVVVEVPDSDQAARLAECLRPANPVLILEQNRVLAQWKTSLQQFATELKPD